MSAVTTAVFLRSYYKYKYRPQYYYLYTMLGVSETIFKLPLPRRTLVQTDSSVLEG